MKKYNPEKHITQREIYEELTQYLIDRVSYQIRTIRDSYGNAKIVKRTWPDRVNECDFSNDEILTESFMVETKKGFFANVFDRAVFNKIRAKYQF